VSVMVPLKRVTRLNYGDALASDLRESGDVPVVGSGGVSGFHSTFNTPGPAIVVGRKGSYGSVHWVDQSCFVIDTAYSAQPTSNEIDKRWLYYVLQAADLNGPSQDVGVPGLSRESAYSTTVPFSPHDEQRRIADFLDLEVARVDALASAQRGVRTLLLERRTTFSFAAVTGVSSADRKPSQLAWAETIPAEWKSVKLAHFARMGSGHTPSRSHPEWWQDCTIPWVTTGEVSQVRNDRLEVLTDTRECISEIGLANSSAELDPEGTVVLCRTAASAGYSAVMGKEMATSQDFATWICGPQLDPFYLLWCLRAMRSDLLGRLAMGSTHKTIYMPDLQGLRIPLPPIETQLQIVSLIHANNTTVDAAIDVIDRQILLLKERKRALIIAAVTGRIPV
jgi:type I restriction enzyme S subunit